MIFAYWNAPLEPGYGGDIAGSGENKSEMMQCPAAGGRQGILHYSSAFIRAEPGRTQIAG